MATERQTAANRANAQKSTGPQTAAGKAQSARNALKSGIYAQTLLLPGEKLEDLETLIAEYYLDYPPLTSAARTALDAVIRADWHSRRLACIDTQILAHEMKTLSRPDPGCTAGQAFEFCRVSMQRVQQRITATDLLFHRNLRVLLALQPDAAAGPAAETVPEPAPEPETVVVHNSEAPAPGPQPLAPALPTAQPIEAKPETQQMGSFRETTPTAPGPLPIRAPQPPTPNPHPPLLPTGHPVDVQDCPNCRVLGYHSPNCHYDLRRAS